MQQSWESDRPAGAGYPSGLPAVTVGRAEAVRRLAEFERTVPLEAGTDRAGAEGLRRAAVCLAVTGDETTGDGLLLTFRSARLRGNPAQYALPGGRLDPGETPEEAALRELHEEVGLALGHAAVLGTLDDFVARSGHLITPIVVWAGHVGELAPKPDEVAMIYRVSLSEVDAEYRTVESDVGPVFQWPFRGAFVHAPTAAMIYQFREVVLHGRATRVGDLGQPRFTWT
ncbi:CoA pyrophosphatase [Tsukamurella sp. 8F]|uniref:NUDIX hydrolase n=1 Tax=unclassified Tsukamurella TaxID=2633480 RepID=UPI0023BA2B17|nr:MULTISPECIES: CoA pyrophosphatase [unclassified Tsukamurella]MDF0529545.1 CoA pyrophosphatase [Tsukamurella sp. 8J]MDF0585767.1 CoA pyrophosphatase [Tsukamurella sp. 8F]